MSLTATFNVTASPSNRMEKEFSDTLTQSITLKEPVSLTAPTILCDITSMDKWDSYNYVTIAFPNLTRKYFVTECDIVRNGLAEYHLREDVLATYSDSILTQNLFVSRSSYGYNSSIRDDMAVKRYLPEADEPIATSDLTQHSETAVQDGVLDLTSTGFTTPLGASGIYYCVVVAWSGESNSATALDSPLGQAPLRNNILKPTMPTPNGVLEYCCDYTSYQFLIAYCKTHTSDAESVISISSYPFEIPHGETSSDTIRLAGKDVSVGTGAKFYLCGHPTLLLADFDWSGNDIMYSTYPWMYGDDSYRIFLPYVGYVGINPSNFVSGDEIQIVYVPLFAFGVCLVVICDVSSNTLIYQAEAYIGQQEAITESNAEQIRDKWTSVGIQVGVGTIADIIKIAYGSPIMKISGVAGLVGNVTSLATTAMTTHDISTAKISNPNTGSLLPWKTYLVTTRVVYIGYGTDDYKMRFGIPRMSSARLTDLKSTSDVFVKTDIDYLPTETGNETERAEIIRLLNQGVILPPKSSS